MPQSHHHFATLETEIQETTTAFAATHIVTAVLNVNFAVLSVVFIVFERG